MRKPQGKNAKRQAVEKQRLRDEADAKRAKGPPLPPSHPLSALPRGALDLYIVFDLYMTLYIVSDAADEVPSGEHRRELPEAASSPPGELSRVLLAIVTRDPLSFLLVFFLTLALALLILSELSRVRANRRVRVALIVYEVHPCPLPSLPCPDIRAGH